MSKKGFLFVVTIFLILTYVLLSISVWVKSVEASERAYSEFYKESTVELAIEQITPEKISNLTHTIMYRALFRLNEHAIDESPVLAISDDGGDEMQNVKSALFDLLMNGSADGQYFAYDRPIDNENSSLRAWASSFNSSLLAIGIYVDTFEVSHFNIRQIDIDLLEYSFELKLGITDYAGTSSVSRSYQIRNTMNIEGLVDPALAQESASFGGHESTIYRQFMFNKDDYSTSGDITINSLHSEIDGGQGWLYGSLASASELSATSDVPYWSDIPEGQRYNYILVGTYHDIRRMDIINYGQFGGYIVTTSPDHDSSCAGYETESETFNPIGYDDDPICSDEAIFDCPANGICTSKPFIVAPNFRASSAPSCPNLGDTDMRRCVLFVNTYLPSEVSSDKIRKLNTRESGIFSIESMRDFVMCGYYTHTPNAPSYMQRLLDDPYSRSDEDFGIETFVIGEYAGDYDLYDTYSRVDTELFLETAGIKMKGMPGCKDHAMCTGEGNPITGIFAVSLDVIDDYGLDDIRCSGAECD